MINWALAEIRKMVESKFRKLITRHRMHARADTENLYIKRENVGRRLIQ